MPTLDWIGKKAVLNHHNEVPFRLLKRNNALSVGDPGSGNLLVQGDNLEALKALLPYYAGQVKCIYIDPPYNTGSEEWIYNDNVNSPEIRDWLGKVVGKEADDLSRHDINASRVGHVIEIPPSAVKTTERGIFIRIVHTVDAIYHLKQDKTRTGLSSGGFDCFDLRQAQGYNGGRF
jgi:hypothetical protein